MSDDTPNKFSGDISDDSDSSLPDPSVLFKKPEVNSPIKPDDIVYAKFKNLYWPSLVRAVYPKEKKISVWFCDDPGKTFKLPLRNVCSFFDNEKRRQIEKDVKKAGYFHEHAGLTTHAHKYLTRKSAGCKDDPMKYFDQTHPFFLIEDVLKMDPNNVSGLEIPPLYVTYENQKYYKKISRISKDDSNDPDAILMESEEEEEESSDNKSTKIISEWKTSDPAMIEFINQIVKCILSGKADEHLENILLQNISSEFYDVYEKAAKCGKRDLNSVSYTGPIDDSVKLRELTQYLFSFYDTIVNSDKRKFKVLKNLFKCKSDAAHFIAAVWLPESIIFAISEIKNVSLPEAKYLYNNAYPNSSKKSTANIIEKNVHIRKKRVIKNGSSAVENSIQQVRDKSPRRKSACAALEKLCTRKLETKKRGNIGKNENVPKLSYDRKATNQNKKSFSDKIQTRSKKLKPG